MRLGQPFCQNSKICLTDLLSVAKGARISLFKSILLTPLLSPSKPSNGTPRVPKAFPKGNREKQIQCHSAIPFSPDPPSQVPRVIQSQHSNGPGVDSNHPEPTTQKGKKGGIHRTLPTYCFHNLRLPNYLPSRSILPALDFCAFLCCLILSPSDIFSMVTRSVSPVSFANQFRPNRGASRGPRVRGSEIPAFLLQVPCQGGPLVHGPARAEVGHELQQLRVVGGWRHLSDAGRLLGGQGTAPRNATPTNTLAAPAEHSEFSVVFF